MKKDLVRDYATEAFRTFARLGCPAQQLHTGDPALDADVAAVQSTLRRLSSDGREGVVDAVRAVYFAAPDTEIAKGDISARVELFAASSYISVPTVYRWLRNARLRFARERGLRIR